MHQVMCPIGTPRWLFPCPVNELMYNQLVANIDAHTPIAEDQRRKITVYMQEEDTRAVWEFQLQANQATRRWWQMLGPVKTYKEQDGFLVKCPTATSTAGAKLKQIIVGPKNTASALLANKIKYGDYYGPLHITTQYAWANGSSFFDTSTGHLQ
jgi:hypothetical protein